MSANNTPANSHKQKHSPIPWTFGESPIQDYVAAVFGADKSLIVNLGDGGNGIDRQLANGALIARAVTCHEELVQTLKAAQDIIGQYGENNAESCEVMERIEQIIEVADQ